MILLEIIRVKNYGLKHPVEQQFFQDYSSLKIISAFENATKTRKRRMD